MTIRLVVLGGSGASTPELIDALAAWRGGSERRPALSVTLVGRSGEKLGLVAAACRARAPRGQPSITIDTSLDRRAALGGVDVVLNQVRVGGLSARAFDETFPRAHGLPGEETMGPGGFANALRTVPTLRSTWEDVAAVAPSALVVNLTNPAGIVSHAALDQVAIRLVSICDSPTTLCERIGERLGVPAATIRRGYLGMNHVGWWTPSSSDELAAAALVVEGLTPEQTTALGAISAPYVRYYLRPRAVLAQQSESRAIALQGLEAKLLESYASGGARPDSPRRGAVWYERALVPLLDAWLNGHPDPLILGLRNGGSVPWLPETAIVEMSVDVSVPGRLAPFPTPELPDLPAVRFGAYAVFTFTAGSGRHRRVTNEHPGCRRNRGRDPGADGVGGTLVRTSTMCGPSDWTPYLDGRTRGAIKARRAIYAEAPSAFAHADSRWASRHRWRAATMIKRVAILAVAGIVALLALSAGIAVGQGDEGRAAKALLHDASGAPVGVVKLTESAGAVRVRVEVQGLPPGFHGFHVHAIGECIPPFASAGGHFNPGTVGHPGHAGDMPVLLVNADGTGEARFASDRYGVADVLGRALIVHVNPDNYANVPTRYAAGGPDATTLATGDAGGRIACGVIERGAGD